MLTDHELRNDYEVILADPPWMEQGSGRVKRGADRHYPLMDTGAIASLDIPTHAAKDSMLFLWSTNNFLPDALEVMRFWQYRYITNMAWVKDRMGLGFYLRGQHELLLIGVRGRPPRARARASRSELHIPPSVLRAPRRAHSQKPDEVYDLIERWSDGPYLEMFARRQREGWDAWGDEVMEQRAGESSRLLETSSCECCHADSPCPCCDLHYPLRP